MYEMMKDLLTPASGENLSLSMPEILARNACPLPARTAKCHMARSPAAHPRFEIRMCGTVIQ